MAKKSGNGHGNGKDPVVTAIHELTAELRGFRADSNARFEAVEQVLRGHGRQLGEVVDRLGRVEVRLEHVEERLDNIRDFAGERYREQGEALRTLAERVARLEARAPDTR
jgi:hypothetical protein